MSLKQLRQVITQAFNNENTLNKDVIGLMYTGVLALSFFIFGAIGILDYFIIKVILFIALAVLLVYCILIMDKNKNHQE
jgi:hypothetical protein